MQLKLVLHIINSFMPRFMMWETKTYIHQIV